MEAEYLDYIFQLAFTEEAMQELLLLQDQLQQTHYSSDATDIWSFFWGTQKYSPKKFYTLAFRHLDVSLVFEWIWKSKYSPRLKFFAWLVVVDRLNTIHMLHRRNLNASQDNAL
jgi:hypothetical protein